MTITPDEIESAIRIKWIPGIPLPFVHLVLWIVQVHPNKIGILRERETRRGKPRGAIPHHRTILLKPARVTDMVLFDGPKVHGGEENGPEQNP